ncbi:2400_t:CDS:2 [Funneliformis geosporum]|uniref:2400_t:CDS:1 n=1 Tax=Funneliformis geosporum TaxID=1117311 RepID=A0A9W4SFD2_9GLOM|nr:2400_t:CDS:2 [Funneliformis geosporum]
MNYTYIVESLFFNEQIENEMCEFIYGIKITKGEKYSRASLKNANFPKLHATLDGTLKEMKRLGIDAPKLHEGLTNEELKIILSNNVMSSNEPEGIKGVAESNTDIRKYILMRPLNCKTKTFYLGISTNASGLGEKRIRGMAISVMQRLTGTVEHDGINKDDALQDKNNKNEEEPMEVKLDDNMKEEAQVSPKIKAPYLTDDNYYNPKNNKKPTNDFIFRRNSKFRLLDSNF